MTSHDCFSPRVVLIYKYQGCKYRINGKIIFLVFKSWKNLGIFFVTFYNDIKKQTQALLTGIVKCFSRESLFKGDNV